MSKHFENVICVLFVFLSIGCGAQQILIAKLLKMNRELIEQFVLNKPEDNS